LDIGFLLPLTVFGGVVLGTMALYSLLVREPGLVRERVKRHVVRSMEAATPREMPTLLKDRRFSAIGWIDQLLQRTSFAEQIALELARAAVPLRVGEYLLIRWLSGSFLALFALAWGLNALVAVAAGAVGFFAPRLYLSLRRQARVNKITNQLMDAMILIANSLKSGYSFAQGLELVTR